MQAEARSVSRILPPKERGEELVTTSFRCPESILKKVDRIAADSGYSRNEVLVHFVNWATREYEEEKKSKK